MMENRRWHVNHVRIQLWGVMVNNTILNLTESIFEARLAGQLNPNGATRLIIILI